MRRAPEAAVRRTQVFTCDQAIGRLATRTADEWETELALAGVPAGKVRRAEEALHLPQLEGRELFLDLPGGESVLNAGFRYSRYGPRVYARAPGLGENSEEVRPNSTRQRSGLRTEWECRT